MRNAGLNLTGTGTYIASPGLGWHESMHAIQFIGYAYIVGYIDKQNGIGNDPLVFLYGAYLTTNLPGAITGAY